MSRRNIRWLEKAILKTDNLDKDRVIAAAGEALNRGATYISVAKERETFASTCEKFICVNER
jgi:hypothetical protein